MRFLAKISCWLALVTLFPLSAYGAGGTGAWQGTEQVQLRLISSTTYYDGGGVIKAGLEVVLADGWKIYWRSPGDAGLPPVLKFVGGASHEMRFPAPKRFTLFGFETFGYSDNVIFPLRIDTQAGGDLVLAAAFEGLVCSDVCIPVDEMLTLRLDRGDAVPSLHAFGIARAEALVPSIGTSNGYRITRAELHDGQLEVAIVARDGSPFIMHQGDVLVESAVQGVGFARPHFLGDVGRIAITGGDSAELVGTSAIMTVLHPQFMLEENVVIRRGKLAPSTISLMGVGALVSMLVVAFLGGLILNVMPCVLPVLSLKLTTILGQDKADLARIRRSFLLSATGIVLSFLSLGVALLVLRQGGMAIGWGIQFQNAYFLGFMALVMLAFALMMLDVVQAPIPAVAAWKPAHTAWRDLASGFMATLLATPCSAPFVGTAIAFAFTAPSALMLAVFLAMALGLALPWLLVAAFPQSARLLPRGGAWVIWLRRVLALGLLATSVWLVLVLGAVLGSGQGASGAWQKWQPQLAARLASEGKIVLVDVTADWCLTCKANQLFVFESKAIKQLFAEENVVLLRADWTRPDATILHYLTRFERYGIPFTAVYNGGDAPLILPEILTQDKLIEAITTKGKQK